MLQHELDMTGAKRVGYLTGARNFSKSICWECRRPTSKCAWLMDNKPFKGSEYMERECWYCEGVTYSVYAITKCPMEVK